MDASWTWRVLSDSQMERIREAALSHIERHWFLVQHEALLARARYRGGASLSYSCNFCTPWEGYILGINGTAGRIEITHHSNPDPTGQTAPAEEKGMITYFPLFGGKEIIEIPAVAGGHGGGDYVIQRDLFDRVSDESRELKLVAGSEDGAISVAMGEAVWRSISEKRPICIPRLLDGTDI